MALYLHKASCFAKKDGSEYKLLKNNMIVSFKDAKVNNIKWLNGNYEYFSNGLRHRDDGPAAKWSNGTEEWYFKGVKINCSSLEEFKQIIEST